MLGDPDYGHDIRQYINAAIVNTNFIAAAIENECLKDERVEGIDVAVTFDASTQTLSAEILVTVSEGEFAFTLDVTETSAAIFLTDEAA
jgi:hypothetical protein